MITDNSLASLCRLAYTDTPDIVVADAKVRVFETPGCTVFAFRGTDPDCVADWLADIDSDAVEAPGLGSVHRGFYRDALAVWGPLSQRVRGPFVLTGHSKGAAEAAVVAALLTLNGKPPARLTTFGMPRPGTLAGTLDTVPGSDYAHAGDPVPEVPTWLPHPRKMTVIGSASIDLLSNHSINSYISGVTQ